MWLQITVTRLHPMYRVKYATLLGGWCESSYQACQTWLILLTSTLSNVYTGALLQPFRYWQLECWLVGWSLTSLFSTNTAISETRQLGKACHCVDLSGLCLSTFMFISWPSHALIYMFRFSTSFSTFFHVDNAVLWRPFWATAADNCPWQFLSPNTLNIA